MKGGNNQLTAFGKLVAKALIDQGRTRAELAVEIGTTPQYLSRILRGGPCGRQIYSGDCRRPGAGPRSGGKGHRRMMQERRDGFAGRLYYA